jgi:dynactin complex subunit
MGRLFELIHQAMETVRFTGELEYRDGHWVGVYGTSSDPSLQRS